MIPCEYLTSLGDHLITGANLGFAFLMLYGLMMIDHRHSMKSIDALMPDAPPLRLRKDQPALSPVIALLLFLVVIVSAALGPVHLYSKYQCTGDFINRTTMSHASISVIVAALNLLRISQMCRK